MYFKFLATQLCGKRSVVTGKRDFFELTKHCNGRTRNTISDVRLKSGIRFAGVQSRYTKIGSSLGIFQKGCIFFTAFNTENIAQFLFPVNPKAG